VPFVCPSNPPLSQVFLGLFFSVLDKLPRKKGTQDAGAGAYRPYYANRKGYSVGSSWRNLLSSRGKARGVVGGFFHRRDFEKGRREKHQASLAVERNRAFNLTNRWYACPFLSLEVLRNASAQVRGVICASSSLGLGMGGRFARLGGVRVKTSTLAKGGLLPLPKLCRPRFEAGADGKRINSHVKLCNALKNNTWELRNAREPGIAMGSSRA
jgi:hypothetical protein